MSESDRIVEWRARGHEIEFRGRRIHLFERPGTGPALVLLHGFPSSSFDWRGLLDHLPDRRVVAFDFLGFGLSDKPRDHDYSLFWQADLTEEIVRRHAGGRAFLVAHDMGTSVATELMARDLDGSRAIELIGALLFSGSIVLERSSPTPAQRLLRGPLGPLLARLVVEPAFRRTFSSLFSSNHPLGAEEAHDQWQLLARESGHRLGHRLVSYMDERERHAERWHGAVRDWPGPLSLAWGLRDPVATPAVLAALRELRPAAPVTELPDLGHYPQIEAPEEIAAAIEAAVGRAAPVYRPLDRG